MPQMAPISWLMLFIFFSIIFIFFNILNYYCFNKSLFNKNSSNKLNMNIKSFIWKW